MTGDYAAQPRKSDSDHLRTFAQPVRSCHPRFPSHGARVLSRTFHRGRVPYWCGTIANGPPTPPQWCGTIPHGQSVSFTSLRQTPRASRALLPLASGVFFSRLAAPDFRRCPLPWCTRPVSPCAPFCLGKVSGSPLPPAYRHRSRLWVDQSTYGLRVRGPELPGLNRVPRERPEPRPTGSPGSGTRIRDSA